MAAYGRVAIGAVIYCAALLLVCSCCCFFQVGNAQTDCSTALDGISGCVAFLSNPSSVPDNKTCCQPLRSVLTTPTSLQCLCAQASSSTNSQLFQHALQLPKACKLSINVSEANCTTTSKSPPASTSSPAGSSNAGVVGASPASAIIALTAGGLCSILSLFA